MKRRPLVQPAPDPKRLTWAQVTEQARVIRDLQELGGVVVDTRPHAGFIPPKRDA